VSLMRAFGALILLFAVMTGATSMAHAHAGHVHQLSALAHSSTVDPGFASGEVIKSGPVGRQSPKRSDPSISERKELIIELKSGQTHTSGACLPGICCCQGLSTCTMTGHCCVGALTHRDQAWVPLASHTRLSFSHQTFHVLEVVFGLDRPPKI
jgi:hypothetical protein